VFLLANLFRKGHTPYPVRSGVEKKTQLLDTMICYLK